MSQSTNSLAARVLRAESAHTAGDLLTVARMHAELSALGFYLWWPEKAYGSTHERCVACGRDMRVIYRRRLAVSVCLGCPERSRFMEPLAQVGLLGGESASHLLVEGGR